MGTHEGHDALRAAYSRLAPRQPQRHLVLNTLVTAGTTHEAEAVSDVVFIAPGKAGWAIQLVGRYPTRSTATVEPGGSTVGWPRS